MNIKLLDTPCGLIFQSRLDRMIELKQQLFAFLVAFSFDIFYE